MALPLTNLNIVAFTVGGTNFLGRLKTASIHVDNDHADGRGAAQRYAYNMNVKQSQKIDFTVNATDMTVPLTPQPATNLSMTVFTIGGTDFLTSLKSAGITVTTDTKDGSYVSQFDKFPVAVGTTVEVTASTMEFASATLAKALITGAIAAMDVTVLLTCGAETFTSPMTLKGAVVKVERGEITMQDVTLALKGTPTSPVAAATSLLGTVLLGTAAVGVALDTGGDSWKTGAAQYAIITKLDVRISDGAIVEQTGSLEIQGSLLATATGT